MIYMKDAGAIELLVDEKRFEEGHSFGDKTYKDMVNDHTVMFSYNGREWSGEIRTEDVKDNRSISTSICYGHRNHLEQIIDDMIDDDMIRGRSETELIDYLFSLKESIEKEKFSRLFLNSPFKPNEDLTKFTFYASGATLSIEMLAEPYDSYSINYQCILKFCKGFVCSFERDLYEALVRTHERLTNSDLIKSYETKGVIVRHLTNMIETYRRNE